MTMLSRVYFAPAASPSYPSKALGIAAGDMSNLMRGKLTGFSQERLEHFLLRLDMEVRIQIAPRPAAKRRAEITVEQVDAFS
ncbi:MAG: helix-turn-helix domain-containing protein [Gemmatimonadota bacterium]|nr:helix-turn-helix domain-containing protein [Gemmatimonadota bacterium]